MRLSLQSYGILILYVILVLVLSIITYYLIEQKFRYQKARMSIYLIGILFLMGVSVKSFQKINNRSWEKWQVIREIDINDKGGKATLKLSNDSSDAFDVLVLGDSHVNNFRIIADSVQFSVAKLYSYGCPTLKGVFRIDGYGNWCNCMSTNDNMFLLQIVKRLEPKYIVLALRYDMYINGLSRDGELQEDNHYIYSIDSGGDTSGYSMDERKDVLAQGLLETIELFKEHTVILSNQLPDLANLGSMKQLYAVGIDSLIYTPSSTEVWADSLLSEIANSRDYVHYFDNRDHFISDNSSLRILTHGDYTYRDDNHASYKLGIEQGRKLIKFIEGLGNSVDNSCDY